MELLGEDFRILRKDKGLRLSDLAEKNMSVQLLSKFERNECNISSEKMLKLLDRMNIFSYEVENIHLTEDLDGQISFLNRLDNLILESDIEGLSQLINREKSRFKIDGNFRHKFNVSIVEQRINVLTGLQIEKKKIRFIVEYLLGVSYWWSYEVTLFRNIIFCLDDEVIEILYFRLIRQCTKKKCQEIFLEQVAYVVIEVVKASLDNNNIYTAKRNIEMSSGIFTDRKCYCEKNELLFWKGVCLVLSGKDCEGKRLINNSLDVSGYMNDLSKRKYFLCQIKKYLELKNI